MNAHRKFDFFGLIPFHSSEMPNNLPKTSFGVNSKINVLIVEITQAIV